jgi:hypothetical protein
MLQTGSRKLFQLDETLPAHQILRASSNVLCCMMWRENASWWRATVKEYWWLGCERENASHMKSAVWVLGWWLGCERENASHMKSAVWVLGWWLGCESENASHMKSAVWVPGWWLVVMHAKKGLTSTSTMGPRMGRENASSIAWFKDSLYGWVEEHGYRSL